MRKTTIIFIALWLVGCDTLNSNQYIVVPEKTVPQEKDIETVKVVLIRISGQFGLQNKTASSHVPATIICFSEPTKSFPVSLGARVASEGIVIDLTHFHPGSSESEEYKAIYPVLEHDLQEKFGSRWQLVPRNKRIPMPRREAKSSAESSAL